MEHSHSTDYYRYCKENCIQTTLKMANFFVKLWESVFEPGTSPQLIIATHVSFVALLLTLLWLIYATNGNIHFYVLFGISLLLWVTVIWFISELSQVKLRDNDELDKDANKKDEVVTKNDAEGKQEKGNTTSSAKPTQTHSRSRKA
ncbi:Pkr1p [Saccharomyces cerevisiae x Saccharomyces kudriavzevii VIN7]|uniref:Pkr1p n=1 Tax=Saccharomyces cerevisiae x Saccharomyces kudriavzevii (strain VIN7) TaxID=1095631 RepID=H0GZD4_SACCK|nr:Pkr1p [Saccharomyces cerevisiae x Saccharomyces kudriavzevii VIN7]